MTRESKYYNKNFYDLQKINSYNSAREIVPCLIEYLNPKSVIDVGCGIGTWLKVFDENGIKDLLGIDGEYIDLNSFLLKKDIFVSHDISKNIALNKKFDLVISLEVAEHLPAESSDILVDTLTKLGSVIYFSAAIPFQGGTNHLNEQWQSYWANKFKVRNFLAIDLIRPMVWTNNNVQACYAQNGIIYIREDKLSSFKSRLKKASNNCKY